MENIKKLENLFAEIVKNDSTFAAQWRNIPLAKQAFAVMKDELPLRVKGELTPYTRIILLGNMLECLPMRDCARFIKEVNEYQLSMFPLISDDDLADDMDIDNYEGDSSEYTREFTQDALKKEMKKVEDYLNPKISMEDWCKTYGVHLKFDPVERSEEWENAIYDVEAECDKLLKDEPKGMGFCFSYWSTKRSVLAKYGIQWASPSTMNPRVMFD